MARKKGQYCYECGDVVYRTPANAVRIVAEFIDEHGNALCGDRVEADRLAVITVDHLNETDCGQLAKSSDEAAQNPENIHVPSGAKALGLLIAIRDYAQDLLDDKGDLSPNERARRAASVAAYADAAYKRVADTLRLIAEAMETA